MRTTTIRGVQVPSLGFGTWQLTGDDCNRGVEHALSVGYRHVDTAQAYGNEDRVGAAIAASGVDRSDVFLTTKVAMEDVAPDRLHASFADSLRDLQTEYVDLLLAHWPNDDVGPEPIMEAMNELVEKGQVRHVGVSNYPPSWLQRAREVTEVFCNQVEYHPLLSQHEMRALAVEHDFLLTAYSPLARGEVMDDPTIVEIAEAHDAHPAQVSLAWLLGQDHVAAIPKATSPSHIESNWAAQELVLSDDERARIDRLGSPEGRVIDPPFAPDWER